MARLPVATNGRLRQRRFRRWVQISMEDPDPPTLQMSERCGIDPAQEADVRFSCPASGNEAAGRIDDRCSGRRRSCYRRQQVIHACNLPGVEACDIKQAVGADVENGECAVHDAQRTSIVQFDNDAGQADALTREVGYSIDVLLSKHAHEGCTG